LRYINAHTLADTIENAWLKTLEDGLHTGDIAESAYTKKRVGTQEFAQEIIKRLGSKPILLMPCPVKTPNFQQQHPVQKVTKPLPIKKLIGADVFVDRKNTIALDIAEIIANFSPKLKLNFISSLGIKVWPNGFSETNCSDHWRCQFIQKDAHTSISLNDIIHLLTALHAAGIDVIKMENLFKFDEELGFTLAQGQ
jgi:isocitrate dehydrogenase